MTPCREWDGRLDRWGYGRTYFRGGPFLVHRKAWIEANGEIPDGLMVLHHCDNPKCYEVSHLYLGTHADNMADMRKKGRNACGERHGTSRLRAEQVLAIRAAAGRHRDVAARFGVSRALVGLIKNRKIWTHLA